MEGQQRGTLHLQHEERRQRPSHSIVKKLHAILMYLLNAEKDKEDPGKKILSVRKPCVSQQNNTGNSDFARAPLVDVSPNESYIVVIRGAFQHMPNLEARWPKAPFLPTCLASVLYSCQNFHFKIQVVGATGSEKNINR